MIKLSDLDNFTGTENWYRHGLMPNVLYTDGVRYLAEHAQAHWLIDKIASLQLLPNIKGEEFQVWRLKVDDRTAKLTCTDGGNGGPEIELYAETIDYTDFQLDEIDLWVEADPWTHDCVILLPSEH